MAAETQPFIHDTDSQSQIMSTNHLSPPLKDEAICNDIIDSSTPQAFPVNLKEVFELTSPNTDTNLTLLQSSDNRDIHSEPYLILIPKANLIANSMLHDSIVDNPLISSNDHQRHPLIWKSPTTKAITNSPKSSTDPWTKYISAKDSISDDMPSPQTVMNLSTGTDNNAHSQSCTPNGILNMDRRRSWPQMEDKCFPDVAKNGGRLYIDGINEFQPTANLQQLQKVDASDSDTKSWDTSSGKCKLNESNSNSESFKLDNATLSPRIVSPSQNQPIELTKNSSSAPNGLLCMLLEQESETTSSPFNLTQKVTGNSAIKMELYTQEQNLVVQSSSKKTEDPSKKGKFSCGICCKVFWDNRTLQRHLQVHAGAKTYRCPMCDKGFMLKGDLTRHVRIHSGEKPYACDVCERRFTLKGNLMQHFRTHAPEKQFTCTICMKNYAQKDSLHRHIRAHFGDKPFQCMICSKKFTLKADLSRHILIHSGVKPHVCSICGRMFSLKGNLTQHLRTHLKAKLSIADNVASNEDAHQEESAELSQSDLSISMPNNPDVPLNPSENTAIVPLNPFIPISSTNNQLMSSDLSFCSACSRTFSSPNALQEHVQLVHEQPALPPKSLHACNLCDKEFSLKGDLNRHINSHNGIKPYRCELCDKLFTLKSNLRQHQTTHVSDKTFTCPLCSKLFGNRRNLSLHLRRHEQASANFTCTRCGRSFLAKSDHFFHKCAKEKESSSEESYSDSKDDPPTTNENYHDSINDSTNPMTERESDSSLYEVKKEVQQVSCNVRDTVACSEGLHFGEPFLGPFYRHLYFATSQPTMLPNLKGFLHTQNENCSGTS